MNQIKQMNKFRKIDIMKNKVVKSVEEFKYTHQHLQGDQDI